MLHILYIRQKVEDKRWSNGEKKEGIHVAKK